jgi:hypothetical protein
MGTPGRLANAFARMPIDVEGRTLYLDHTIR